MIEHTIKELSEKSDHDLLILTAASSLRAEQQLKEMNGSIKDTCVKLAKNEEIAKQANDRSKVNRGDIIRLFIGIITIVCGGIAVAGGVIAAFIQRGF